MENLFLFAQAVWKCGWFVLLAALYFALGTAMVFAIGTRWVPLEWDGKPTPLERILTGVCWPVILLNAFLVPRKEQMR